MIGSLTRSAFFTSGQDGRARPIITYQFPHFITLTFYETVIKKTKDRRAGGQFQVLPRILLF